jgi:hypothetical protein
MLRMEKKIWQTQFKRKKLLNLKITNH